MEVKGVYMKSTPSKLLPAALFLVATILVGCPPTTGNTDGTSPLGETAQQSRQKTKAALESLPEWSKYAPPIEEYDGPKPVTATTASASKLNALASGVFEPSKSTTEVVGGVQYTCTTTPYTIRKNPSEIVTLQPDADALYPGSLLQGASHKLGSLQPLVIDDRTPIEISIDLLSDGVREVVPNPTVGGVREAIGKMIQLAKSKGIAVAGAGMATNEESSSNESFALKADLSGRYLLGKMSASFDYSRNASERILNATIIQKAFTVSVQPPESIDSWFKPSFTKDKYDALVAKGAIGADSPPIYVSSVTYGRMLLLNVKVFTEGKKIIGKVKGSYSGGVFSVQGQVENQSALQTFRSEIRVVGIGASGKALSGSLVTDGDLKSYLNTAVTLDEMAPIAYSMRDLRTKLPAKIAEFTDYDVKNCDPVLPNKVGERMLFVVDGIWLRDAGDGSDDGEISGAFALNEKEFWNQGEHSLSPGKLIGANRIVTLPDGGKQLANGEFNSRNDHIVFDCVEGAKPFKVIVDGYVNDADTFSTQRIMTFDFNSNPITFNCPTTPERGRTSQAANAVLYRMVKLCNLVLDPVTKTVRPENNSCLDANSEINKE